MNEITKTIVFAVVGSLLAAAAAAFHVASQPEVNEQFALVGEEFFPEFDSADEVTFLEIADYDVDKGEPRRFRVEFKDDLWRIPSHHDYPAESPDRLFGTAASVIGIQREALKGRRENEHARFGVIDPTSAEAREADDPEAVGVRVTLGKADGKTLADYIVGKEVESQDMDDEMLREIRGEQERKPRHYVRRADEKETYIATITIDASTKFSDWIEPDLLLLDSSDLRELVINDYSFEKKIEEVELIPNSGIFQQVTRSVKKDGDAYKLTKDSDFGSWTLDGLDEESEELDTSKITNITSALDNFKILGVRPRLKIDGKPILTPELILEFPESIRSQGAAERAIQEVALDLESKGFNLSQNRDDGSLNIASDQGELIAATKDGIVYRLYFGSMFEGTESEIEIGGTANRQEKNAESPADPGEAEGPETSEADDDTTNSDKKKSRYLLVRVEFDPRFLGEKPQPPVEPTKPEKPPEVEDATSPDDAGQDAATAGTEVPAAAGESDNDGKAKQDSAAADEPSATAGDSDPVASNTDADKEDSATRGESAAAEGDDASPAKDSEGQEKEEKDDPEAAYKKALSQYELDMLQYEQDKSKYEKDLQEYEDKLAKGQEKVAKLNERFGDWYYVISAVSIESLRLSRDDLVREKEKQQDEAESATPAPLGLPELPDLPGTAEKADDSEDEKPEATDSTPQRDSTTGTTKTAATEENAAAGEGDASGDGAGRESAGTSSNEGDTIEAPKEKAATEADNDAKDE